MPKQFTNNDLSHAINELRLEIKGDIGQLSTQVENIRISQAVSSTKIGMLVAGISLVVSAFVSAIVSQIKGRIL